MTNDERLAYLLETAPIPSNRGRLTHTWVAENISLAVADAVYGAVNDVSVPTALRYATGNGIDTTADLWKLQAAAVAANNELLSPHLAALKDFEYIYQPRWQTLGYEVAPTLESVTLAATKRQLEDSAVDALQAFREALSSWDGSGDAPVLGGG